MARKTKTETAQANARSAEESGVSSHPPRRAAIPPAKKAMSNGSEPTEIGIVANVPIPVAMMPACKRPSAAPIPTSFHSGGRGVGAIGGPPITAYER